MEFQIATNELVVTANVNQEVTLRSTTMYKFNIGRIMDKINSYESIADIQGYITSIEAIISSALNNDIHLGLKLTSNGWQPSITFATPHKPNGYLKSCYAYGELEVILYEPIITKVVNLGVE